MPKPKNRVFCRDCRRPKLLFETEKKAETFIRFNGDEVNSGGDSELRVYYCTACCGYHITSKPFDPGYDRRTDRAIRAYHRDRSRKLFSALMSGRAADELEVDRILKGYTGYTDEEKEAAKRRYLKKIRQDASIKASDGESIADNAGDNSR